MRARPGPRAARGARAGASGPRAVRLRGPCPPGVGRRRRHRWGRPARSGTGARSRAGAPSSVGRQGLGVAREPVVVSRPVPSRSSYRNPHRCCRSPTRSTPIRVVQPRSTSKRAAIRFSRRSRSSRAAREARNDRGPGVVRRRSGSSTTRRGWTSSVSSAARPLRRAALRERRAAGGPASARRRCRTCCRCRAPCRGRRAAVPGPSRPSPRAGVRPATGPAAVPTQDPLGIRFTTGLSAAGTRTKPSGSVIRPGPAEDCGPRCPWALPSSHDSSAKKLYPRETAS